MQLGVLGERLLERSQQLKAQTFHCLEQRIRVGLGGSWVKGAKQAEALERWQDGGGPRRGTRRQSPKRRKSCMANTQRASRNKPLQLS